MAPIVPPGGNDRADRPQAPGARHRPHRDAPRRSSRRRLAGATADSKTRMRLSETLHLLRPARPPAPYGAQTLARCYSVEDVARQARRRLPLGSRAYLDGGGEGEYTLRRNRAAFDDLEFLPRQPGDVSSVDTSTTVLG